MVEFDFPKNRWGFWIRDYYVTNEYTQVIYFEDYNVVITHFTSLFFKIAYALLSEYDFFLEMSECNDERLSYFVSFNEGLGR